MKTSFLFSIAAGIMLVVAVYSVLEPLLSTSATLRLGGTRS